MNKKKVNIIAWVLQSIISIAFLMAGGMKLATPYPEYVEMMPYASDFSSNSIKLIGILEILGVIGLNLPLLIRKLRIFSLLSALGLAGTMIGAIQVHFTRSEPFTFQIALLLILLIIAILRFNQLKKMRNE